jgi:general secretion pathway protein D
MKRSLQVVVLLAILFALNRHGNRLHSQEYNKYYENTLKNLCPPSCLIPGENEQRTTTKDIFSRNDLNAREEPYEPMKTTKNYKVIKGDTLFNIANGFQVSVQELKKANGIMNDLIKVGQVLEIPSNVMLGKTEPIKPRELAHDTNGEEETKTINNGPEREETMVSALVIDASEPKQVELREGEIQTKRDVVNSKPAKTQESYFQVYDNISTVEQRQKGNIEQQAEAQQIEPRELSPDTIDRTEMSAQKEGSERKRGGPSVKENDPKNIFELFEELEVTSETKRPKLVQTVPGEIPREKPTSKTPGGAQEETTDPQAIPEGEEVVNLQSEMDIRDLVQTVSEITGETFLLDESVKARKVTVISPRGGFNKRNAIRLFEAILDLNGFSIVQKDGINKIVPKRDIKTENLPTEIGTQYGTPSDRFVTRLVPLKNINAAEVANVLRPLISREGDILVYPALNTLIIIDTVSNVNKLLKIIGNIDLETEIEFIKLKYTEAVDVAATVSEILGGGGAAPAARSVPQTTTQQRQTRTPQRVPTQSQAAGQASFKIIPDERTNSLIVIAYPEDMKKIKAVIQELDVDVEEPEQGIYVIRLQNADAEQVVGVLSGLIGGGTGAATTQSARTTQRRTTGGLGETLGSSYQRRQTGTLGAFGESEERIQRGETGLSGLSAIVAEAEGIRITADPSTNSIIIVSSRKDFESIKGIIDELDIRRKQVFVEAAILEVALDQIKSLGTNLSFGFIFNDDNLAFGGTTLPGIPSLLGIAANTGSVVSAINSISGGFLGVIGDTVDPDGSGPIPPIPSFTALFQALTSLTDVNVLSTPSIVTTDNEEAEIVVADVIPFPTGSTVGETGVTIQTIDRQPVGIRLGITPQISEGDFLNLNIHTEVSAVAPAPPGLNTAEFGIATTTRTADSAVVVKNGQTIVIGGLVQDRESVLESKVPLLGDVPFFGNLFKFKRKQSTKINLMILLTPRIIENEGDMQKILEERQKRNMLLQQNGFEKEGGY